MALHTFLFQFHWVPNIYYFLEQVPNIYLLTLGYSFPMFFSTSFNAYMLLAGNVLLFQSKLSVIREFCLDVRFPA
jgi:hypothetical protein